MSNTAWLCAAAAALTLVAGCGDNQGSDGGPQSDITGAVAALVRDESGAALDALSLPTLLTPLGAGASSACATPTTTPVDGDGDGVPDEATWIFTAPPCRFTGYRGGTLDVVGDLRIEDPAPAAAGFGYQSTLTAVRSTFTPSGDSPDVYTVTRNGTRALSGSVAGLQLSADLQVARTFAGKPDAAVDEQWTATFTPETPLQINTPLPGGTLDIAGTLDWTQGTDNFLLTVTTPTPLHYDASCSDARRFDAGELRAAGTIAGTAGYVRVVWTECGKDPQVSFVAQ
jgi:hypothetical protein